MCDPNQTNHEGDTPLHILCSSQYQSERMIAMLISISIPEIILDCINHSGHTPLELVPKSYTSRILMISKYLWLKQVKLETYLKIFVLGNSGNGKSTLIKAITTEASQLLKFILRYVNPNDVPPHTAGIVPIPFNSKHFGHALLYDFAGQHQYYSSHAAVMENLILPSPPLFLLLIDISKPMEKIKEELMYWWLYIDNHCQRAMRIPHAILVGSHEDIARFNGEDPHRKMKDITENIMSKEVSFTLGGYFLLDCRRLASKGLTGLLSFLTICVPHARHSEKQQILIFVAIFSKHFLLKILMPKLLVHFQTLLCLSILYYHKIHLNSFRYSQHSVIKVTYYYFRITLM